MSNKLFSSSKRWEKYFALTATSLSTLPLAAGEARAAVIKVLDRPVVMPSAPGSAAWDVDGNGARDFGLVASMYINDVVGLFTNRDIARGRGLVGNVVDKLSSGFAVGPTLAAGKGWYDSGDRTVSYGGYNLSNFSFREFTAGDNYFGFRFDKDGNGNLHYGYAIAHVNDPQNDVQFTITKWAYNDVADAPLTVGPLNADPPTGVPGPIGLAGLAAGAACSRRLRKRIRQTS